MHNSMNDAVSDWSAGLPSADDITPLSQSLIPPELATAFKISPEPPRTALDVNRASQSTLTSLRSGSNFDQFMAEADEGGGGGGSDSKKSRRIDDGEDSAIDNDQSAAKKRTRLVWTPQLHKRFVEVVAHLGLKNAVPKTIMQLMNVEGLTRENVASHLQKYRLYVKRMQGSSSNEGPSPSDHLFASTPLHSLSEPSCGGGSLENNGGSRAGVQVPMMPYPSTGNGYERGNANHHHYHHHHHHYQQQQQQQQDWSGSKYNSTCSHQVTQNNQPNVS